MKNRTDNSPQSRTPGLFAGRTLDPISRACLLLLPLLSAVMWIGESRSNAYPIGEYFLDYKHGFLKRALLGQLLSYVGYLSSTRIFLVEMATVLLAVAIAYAVFWRMLNANLETAVLTVFFLCSPVGLPHFSILAAQPDTQLFSLLLIAYFCLARLRSPVWAPVAALVPCIVALLVHEAFPLLLYPAILVILWDGWRHRKFSTPAVLIHLGGFLSAFLLVLRNGKLKVDPMVLLHNAQARTDYPFDPNIFFILTFNYSRQWKTVLQHYTPGFLAVVFASIAIDMPLIVALVYVALKVNRARENPLPGWAIYATLCTPMALCFLGHDLLRWLAGGEVSLMLFVLYLAETGGSELKAQISTLLGPAFLGLLLYGFAIGPLGGGTVRILTQVGQMLSGV